jgi:hypothetical protein
MTPLPRRARVACAVSVLLTAAGLAAVTPAKKCD